MVVLENEVVFTFTGIAQIGIKKTDLWIAEQILGSKNPWDAVERVRSSLERIRGELHRKNAGIAISVDLWCTKVGDDLTLHPWNVVITNLFDKTTGLLTGSAQPTIYGHYATIPDGQKYAFRVLGQEVPGPHLKLLMRRLRQAAERLPETQLVSDPDTVVRLLRECTRNVATRNSLVGEGLMVSTVFNRSLPKYAKADNRFFHYQHARDDALRYAPIIVTGGTIIRGMKAPLGAPPIRMERAASET
jgi:hypothetical protein